MVVRTPRVKVGTEYNTYKEMSEGVGLFTPLTGEFRTFPATTDVISWLDNEGIALETRGRHYALDAISGRASTGMLNEPLGMYGWLSRDQRYSYRPGSLKVWSLWGPETDCLGCPVDSTREGRNKELTERMEEAIGGHPLVVSKGSFWVQGDEHYHDLCIGVKWQSTPTSDVRCEVLVIDVLRKVVTKRVTGTLIGPAMGGTMALVFQGAKPLFLSL